MNMHINLKFSKPERESLMLFTVSVLAVFRFSYFGFSYLPYLDDYIQYSFYPSYPNAWQNILKGGAGILSTRPLAGLFDFFVWSKFYSNLGIAVGIISVLYALSGVFFYKALKKCNFSVGPIFFAVFLFLPLNSEGTYWLSASTRIVVSLFLISISLFAAANKKNLLFFCFNFLSMWFYEQTAILSFVAAMLIGAELKSPKVFFLAVFSALLLFLFYMHFGASGDNASRLQLTNLNGFFKNLLYLSKSFLKVLGSINFKITFKGFLRGFNIISMNFSFFWLAALTILTMLFFNFSQDIVAEIKSKTKIILVGTILTLMPLVPFLLIQNSVLNLRNITPCLLGISILLDGSLTFLFKKHTALVAAVLIFLFSISSVSEVHDYNFVAKSDNNLAAKLSTQVKPDTKQIKVRITSPKYPTQNAPYNDHIMSMTGSDWGLTGIVRTISKNPNVVVELK